MFNKKDYDGKKLPNDPDALKDIIEGLIHHFTQKVEELQGKISHLEHQVETLKHKHYGRKSEKLRVNKTLSSLKEGAKQELSSKNIQGVKDYLSIYKGFA